MTAALGMFGNTALLTVRNSTISGNTATALSTTESATVQGAGLFTTPLATLTLTHALIAHNTPDQCFGC